MNLHRKVLEKFPWWSTEYHSNEIDVIVHHPKQDGWRYQLALPLSSSLPSSWFTPVPPPSSLSLGFREPSRPLWPPLCHLREMGKKDGRERKDTGNVRAEGLQKRVPVRKIEKPALFLSFFNFLKRRTFLPKKLKIKNKNFTLFINCKRFQRMSQDVKRFRNIWNNTLISPNWNIIQFQGF